MGIIELSIILHTHIVYRQNNIWNRPVAFYKEVKKRPSQSKLLSRSLVYHCRVLLLWALRAILFAYRKRNNVLSAITVKSEEYIHTLNL